MSATDCQPQTVLKYWFGHLTTDGWTMEDRNTLWFGGKAEDDDCMRDRFGATVELALAGQLQPWLAEPSRLMAYILLLDQMTRAIWRGKKAAFAGDEQALVACRLAIQSDMHTRLPPVYCRFLYLPLEHSEMLTDQQQCVSLFKALQLYFPKHKQEFMESEQYAQQHLKIIQRFGRFPHRNTVLERKSSAEEVRYLQEGGATFNQK